MNPWKLLGLKPGADRAEIRRAYARLLKSTNPEDDPEGFMRLRAAHDAALQQLQWRQQWDDEDADDDGDEAAETAAAASAEAADDDAPVATVAAPAPPTAPESAADQERAAEQADLLARQEALVTAIAGRPDDQQVALDRLLAAPALDDVAARARIEHWLAGLIASSLPASDPLVVPAITRFGWDDLPRDRTPPAIAALLQRREEGEFVARIARPHTDLHIGYMALSQPPPPRWRLMLEALFSAAPAQTRTILGLVDGRLPGIADWLNGDAIAAWRDWHSQPRLRLWMIVTMLPLAAVVLVGLLEASGWPEPVQQGVGLLAWAAPFGLLALLRARRRVQDDWDRPDWHFTHWPLAAAALPVLAALWPGLPALTPLFLLPVLAVVIWPLLVLDRLEPASWKELAPGLIRSQPLWFVLMLVIGEAGAADAGAPVRVLACAALALLWWQGGDAMAWAADRRLGPRAPLLLAGLGVAVAAIAAALPLLPLDRALLAGRGLALLPLGLLAGLIGFRIAQGWRQALPAAVLGLLWLALTRLLEVIDPGPAQSGGGGLAGLAGPASRMLLLAGIILAVNWWRNRGRRNNHHLLVAMLVSFVLGVVLAGLDPGRHRPPPAAETSKSRDSTPRPIGEPSAWLSLDTAASAAPPGRYRLEARLNLGTDGKIAGCRLEQRSGIKPVDLTACLQLMARGRYTPAHDIKGKAVPAVEYYRLEWTVRPTPRASPAPRPEPVIRCPETRVSGPMVAEPCMREAWIGDGDYPAGPLARGESGTVKYRLAINSAGRVERCDITQSSGHAGLDRDTCALITRRARFVPAQDVDGSPMPWDYASAVAWQLTNR